MKRKTVALYDPYLDVMGGGERHILSILHVLQSEGYDVHIFWKDDLNTEIKNKLALHFNPEITFIPDIFQEGKKSLFDKLNTLKTYDIFIYVTDGSYFFSTAKHNIIFCMVPQKSLYNMTPLNKIKTMNATFISNSRYTQDLLKKWGVSSDVIYPFIAEDFFHKYAEKKEKHILVVGRFFRQLHAKRQDLAIQWFQTFQQNGKLDGYKLILAGSVKDEDQTYYNELQKLAQGNKTIAFYPNCSFEKLLTLYSHAEMYWHLSGINVDLTRYPEKAEHLGITPLEAMASGCVVFGYNAGGLQEIIKDGETGYLFNSQEELLDKMQHVLNNRTHKEQLQKNAHEFVKKTFDYSIFTKRVKKILL